MPPTRRRPPSGAGGRPSAVRRPVAAPRRPPRRPIRWSTRIAGGVALLVITAGGLGHAVVGSLTGAIDRVDAFGGMQGRPDGTEGTNFLLVGTDGRDGLDPADKRAYHLGGAPCRCTDTIMLAHLSKDRRRVSIVSIPRDSYVRLPDAVRTPAAGRVTAAEDDAAEPGAGPGTATSTSTGATTSTATATPTATATGGVTDGVTGADADTYAAATHPAKINQAFAEGGPKLTVRTVEQLTGVHVDHYLEVDFTSFMKTVDVIGGVPVCTTVRLTDSYSGLDLPAGTTVLDGGRALQYVRSRHLDGSADLGRMQRQQRFLAQVIHKITSGGTLRDPLALSRVAGTVLGSVRADQDLGATDLMDLAQGMKGFSPRSSEFVSVPLGELNRQVPGVGSTVVWDEAKAGRLWAALRADRPLASPHRTPHTGTRVEVAPATVRVALANGTAVTGLAAAAQRDLRATGFLTPRLPTTARRPLAHTEIRYDPRWDRSVKTLAAALPGARLVPAPGQGPVMRVTLGADFTTVTPVTAAPGRVGEDAVTGDEVVCR